MKKIDFREDVLPLKDSLFRLALRITLNREEAEDIVQDTLLKVWNRQSTWQSIDSIEAYCTTICRNLALDHLKRHENRTQLFTTEEPNVEDTSATPYEKMLHEDRMRLIRHLIDSLPEKQRTCMQLRDMEGKTYKDIAAALDITEEQVKVNIFRARQALKLKVKHLEAQ